MTQQKDKYNFVLYVPEVKHEGFRVTETGTVVLEFAVNPVRKLMGKLVNREPVSDIEFDELSSTAWLSIDGARSVLDIARIQSAKTGDDIDEAVRRVVKFMRYVAKRGWIRFKEVQQI
ncbi:MAG TPA: hypothetical protein VIK31_07965 [Propionibacteriaceae bacterium]